MVCVMLVCVCCSGSVLLSFVFRCCMFVVDGCCMFGVEC